MRSAIRRSFGVRVGCDLSGMAADTFYRFVVRIFNEEARKYVPRNP